MYIFTAEKYKELEAKLAELEAQYLAEIEVNAKKMEALTETEAESRRKLAEIEEQSQQ